MGDFGEAMRELTAMTKGMRDERLVRFENNILPRLKRTYDVETKDNGTRYVVHGTRKGTLTVYPKANNLQVHNEGAAGWKKPAVEWLYENGII